MILILCIDAFEFFSNVVSAVLAFAFDFVSGRGGLSGWQWYVCLRLYAFIRLVYLTISIIGSFS